jgi:hypothetical protein
VPHLKTLTQHWLDPSPSSIDQRRAGRHSIPHFPLCIVFKQPKAPQPRTPCSSTVLGLGSIPSPPLRLLAAYCPLPCHWRPPAAHWNALRRHRRPHHGETRLMCHPFLIDQCITSLHSSLSYRVPPRSPPTIGHRLTPRDAATPSSYAHTVATTAR